MSVHVALPHTPPAAPSTCEQSRSRHGRQQTWQSSTCSCAVPPPGSRPITTFSPQCGQTTSTSVSSTTDSSMSFGSKMAGSVTILSAIPIDVRRRGLTAIEEGFNDLAVLPLAGIVTIIEHIDDRASLEAQPYAGVVPAPFLF